MDKKLIDQLWNRATRETSQDGTLNERYRFAQLVFELGVKHGPDYKHGYADGAFEAREACAKFVEDWDSDSADPREVAAAIRARGNNA